MRLRRETTPVTTLEQTDSIPAVYIDIETGLYLPGRRYAHIGNGVIEACRYMHSWGYDPKLSSSIDYNDPECESPCIARALAYLAPEFSTAHITPQSQLTPDSGIALISGRNEHTPLPLVLLGTPDDREYDRAAYELENWYDPRLRGILELCARDFREQQH